MKRFFFIIWATMPSTTPPCVGLPELHRPLVPAAYFLVKIYCLKWHRKRSNMNHPHAPSEGVRKPDQSPVYCGAAFILDSCLRIVSPNVRVTDFVSLAFLSGYKIQYELWINIICRLRSASFCLI